MLPKIQEQRSNNQLIHQSNEVKMRHYSPFSSRDMIQL